MYPVSYSKVMPSSLIFNFNKKTPQMQENAGTLDEQTI